MKIPWEQISSYYEYVISWCGKFFLSPIDDVSKVAWSDLTSLNAFEDFDDCGTSPNNFKPIKRPCHF